MSEEAAEWKEREASINPGSSQQTTTPGKSLPWEIGEEITEKNRGLGVLQLTTDCQYGRIKLHGKDLEHFNVMCPDKVVL